MEINDLEDYEKNILGCVLQEGHLIGKIYLKPEDFYSSRHQAIFSTMLNMRERRIPIDELTVFQEIRQKGLENDVGGFVGIGQLKDIAISSANINYYVEKVLEESRIRKIKEGSQRIIQAIDKGTDLKQIREMQTRLFLNQPTLESKLSPISAKDLPDTQQIDSLWGEIFYPGCITQINSEPGVGKTTLLYNLCAHGAMGVNFLEIPFSKPMKTLYFDLETPLWFRRPKLERIVGCKNLPENLFLHYSLDLRADYPELLLLCKKEKFDLIVFDTQSRTLAMEKENDNSEANYLMGLMRKITNETECTLSLIHHTSKSDNSKGAYRGRGASAIAGGVDIIVNLEALDEDIIKLSVGKNRIIGTNPVLYLRKAGEDLFEPYTPPGESSGFEIFNAQRFILSLSSHKLWSTGEICDLGEKEGFNKRTVERSLKRLAESGKVVKVKHGIYRLRQTDNSDKDIHDGTVGMSETEDFDIPEVIA